MKTKTSFYAALLAVTATVLAITGSAYGTNGMRVIGVGPIQRSMGGASVALPLDAATTITNPAGLSELQKRLDIGATYFSPDVSYKAHSNFGMITNDNSTVSSDTGGCTMPSIGLALPIDEIWSFGLGAYGVCGMGVDYKSNLYNNITYTEYGFMKIAPAIAQRFGERLSLGVALNLDCAQMEYEAGTTSEVSHNNGKEYGLGFTAGAIYKLTDTVTLGLAYESKQAFSDFEFNTTGGKDKLSLDQPQNITLGVGLRPAERVRIAFDVAWIDWPQTIGKNKPVYSKNSSGAAPWNMNWDEQYVYKVGLEYDLSEKVKLRAGYNYGKNPLDSSRAFENISFPAIAEHHITAGAGIMLKKNLALNIGFMYAPRVSFDTGNSAQYIDSATTKMSQYSIDIGLSYTF
ncbi:MAG: TonB-dependent receptor [Sedimentisphaerales bacterium]|nr:TonB-dependent receptor [Sedimentisphaerales bacterium]